MQPLVLALILVAGHGETERLLYRKPSFHGNYYREPYNYRNVFDYPWHGGHRGQAAPFPYTEGNAELLEELNGDGETIDAPRRGERALDESAARRTGPGRPTRATARPLSPAVRIGSAPSRSPRR